MGRESSISFELVAAEAAKLKAKNIKVTNQAVRDALGTGSLSTIGLHMNSYRASEKRLSEYMAIAYFLANGCYAEHS